MPAANGEENPRQPEPNWIDKWMLYISGAGVLAVIFYGYQAWVANGLTRRIIGESARPFIQIIVEPNQQVQKIVQTRTDGGAMNTIGINYYLVNIGKLPGKGELHTIVKWSPTSLEEPPDLASVPAQQQFIWPSIGGATPFVAKGTENMTDGQYADLRGGLGFIYFRAEMKYGNGYTTSVCWKISLVEANKDATSPMMAKLANFSLWSDTAHECPTNAN